MRKTSGEVEPRPMFVSDRSSGAAEGLVFTHTLMSVYTHIYTVSSDTQHKFHVIAPSDLSVSSACPSALSEEHMSCSKVYRSSPPTGQCPSSPASRTWLGAGEGQIALWCWPAHGLHPVSMASGFLNGPSSV